VARKGEIFSRSVHRVHTEWQRPLSGVLSNMMEKLSQAGEDGGGGVDAHLLSLYLPSRTKLQCTLQLRGQNGRYTPPISSLWVDAHLLSLYLPSRAKLQCTLQLRGQNGRYTHPFHLYPYVLWGSVCLFMYELYLYLTPPVQNQKN
jgi:hypothetical protein